MRFLDATGKDVLKRKDRVWSTHDAAARTIEVLRANESEVPSWLQLVADETAKLETATFAMHCYWVGEVKLGGIDGVITTKAAWRDDLEVVELTYDPKVVAYETLLDTARSFDCASKVYTHTDAQHAIATKEVGKLAVRAEGESKLAKASDRHYELRKSAVHYVPMTPMQRTKANAAKDPASVLSPRQREVLSQVEAALEADADALDGLEPAEAFADLGTYSKSLAERL